VFANRTYAVALLTLCSALPANAISLIYSTFLGEGGNTSINAVAVDAGGNAYVTGDTDSFNFPATPGAFHPTNNGLQDAFVSKLNPTGTALIYSTYLGGNANDQGFGIAIDSAGRAYVSGETHSSNFPVTPNAFQNALAGNTDAFLTALDATGATLFYSTYLGGASSDDVSAGIALAGNGLVYIAGWTFSNDFPVSTNAYQLASEGGADGFVASFDTSASGSASLMYSTYLGGSSDDFINGIAVDGAGSAYVTGQVTSSDFPTTANSFKNSLSGGVDAFVSRLNSTGNLLLYSTYLGGNGGDFARAIHVASPSRVYITGTTNSIDFNITPGAFQTTFAGFFDAFIAQLNLLAAGPASLVYATYLGGNDNDGASAIRVDSSGGAIVTGTTTSTNFPITPDGASSAGNPDVFLTRLNAVGSAISYSTYFGGDSVDVANGLAIDSFGNAYVVGFTFTSDGSFPITPGAFQQFFGESSSDGFVAKASGTAPVNHTLLYSVMPQTGSHGPFYDPVKVQDRFSTQTVSIGQPTNFGIPIGKFSFDLDENFPVLDPNLHFVSYRITPTTATHLITATDQFGNLQLILHGGNTLLVPAYELAPNKDSKALSLAAKQHFRCYDINAKLSANNGIIDANGNFFDPPVVGLFENELSNTEPIAAAIRPRWYCVGAKVTADGFYDSDITSTANSYLCYDAELSEAPVSPQFNVKTLDQFGPGVFKTVNNNMLCLPSTITSTSF
jgi:hypothetical protein